MSGHYAELAERRGAIVETISLEEQRFSQTLNTGMALLLRDLDELQRRGELELPGEIAFRLYDTHGFPLELTEEVAHERGMTVDRAGYEGAILRQQEQARHPDAFARKGEEDAWTLLVKTLPATTFTGYTTTSGTSEIAAILMDGQPAEDVSPPHDAVLVLAETPFYAEAGGPVSDQRVIGNASVPVQRADTKRPLPGLIAHHGTLMIGPLRL